MSNETTTISLRNVPPSLHSAIKSVAAGQGKTLQAFAIKIFRENQAIARREREIIYQKKEEK